MNLADTIKALEEKYSDKKEEKPYVPSYKYVSLAFQPGSDTETEFLKDLDGLEFKKVFVGRQAYYQSATLELQDAQKVEKLLNKKKNASIDFLGAKKDDEGNSLVRYNDIIKDRTTAMTVSVYADDERDYRIKDYQKTEAYYKNLTAFEKRLVENTNFPKEFCFNLAVVIRENFDTKAIKPLFATDDPVTSLVNEIFEFTLKLANKNFVEWHSPLYPHLFMVDSVFDYRDSELRSLINNLKDKPSYEFYETMVSIMKKRFSGVDKIEPLYNYKHMTIKFPKKYDEGQISEESDYSISYWLSRDHIVEKGVNPLSELISIVSKAALYYSSVNNAHELHKQMSANNATATEIQHIFKEYFKDRVDWTDWKNVLAAELNNDKPCAKVHSNKHKNQP